MHSFGIEIGGTKLQIAVGDPKTGTIESMYRYDVEKEKGAQGILDQIEQSIHVIKEKPNAVGIGFGGPVNRLTGTVATSHQIGGWSGFELKKWCEEKFKVKTCIENDANTAALGEATYGAGKEFSKVFYITLGSGVGGGMIINKKIFHGNTPGEAEVGLMRMDKDGNTLEAMCSGWALNKIISEVASSLASEAPLKMLLNESNEPASKALLPALLNGDTTAKKIIENYADTLSWGLSHVVHLFNPEIVVLGGGVSLIGEPLREQVEKRIQNYLAQVFRPGPIIRLSELGEKVVPIGALSLTLEN